MTDENTDYEPPGEEPWVVTTGVDMDGDLVIQAITENVDLGGVDALEHRFYLVDHYETPVALYAGVMVHTCQGEDDDTDGADDADECDLYVPTDLSIDHTDAVGTATLSDLPESVRDRIGEPFGGLETVEPRDLDEENDATLLGPEEMGLLGMDMPDYEGGPRGFQ